MHAMSHKPAHGSVSHFRPAAVTARKQRSHLSLPISISISSYAMDHTPAHGSVSPLKPAAVTACK